MDKPSKEVEQILKGVQGKTLTHCLFKAMNKIPNDSLRAYNEHGKISRWSWGSVGTCFVKLFQ